MGLDLFGGLLGGGSSGGTGGIGGPGQKSQTDTSTQTSYSTANNATGGSQINNQTFSGVTGGTFNLSDMGSIKAAFDLAHSALAANDSLSNQLLTAAGGALAASTQSSADQTTPLSSQLLKEMVVLGTIIALAFVATKMLKS